MTTVLYRNYGGPGFLLTNVGLRERPTRVAINKLSRNKNASQKLKAGLDSITQHFQARRRPLASAEPISDTEYNRLHDIRFDSDRAFLATLFHRWQIRNGRLVPWTELERKQLMRRWYSKAKLWLASERLLFVDAGVLPCNAKPSRDAAYASASANAPSANAPSADIEEGSTTSEDGGVNASKTDAEGPTDSPRSENADDHEPPGGAGAKQFEALVKLWSDRAGRRTPWPTAVANKLVSKWLGPESGWSPTESFIFQAGPNPRDDGVARISSAEKRSLLDRLVRRDADGSATLANGGKQRQHREVVVDEPFATPLDGDVESPSSEYEKELRHFLAKPAIQRCQLIKAAVNAEMHEKTSTAHILTATRSFHASDLKSVLFTYPPFGFTFTRGCR